MRLIFMHFLIFFLTPQTTVEENYFNFIVWNVGQGSWSTFFNASTCLHFDMGGEKAPLKKIKKLCHRKANQIFLSHEDWDHIRFIYHFRLRVADLCLNFPGQQVSKQALRSLPRCSSPHPLVQTLFSSTKEKASNDRSVVYSLQNQVLFPGDSSLRMEKVWISKAPRSLYLLILSHHGSRTANSKKLIQWTKPKMAISSARYKRYGHPHKDVELRLQKGSVPLLKTEEQGHLFFHLKIKKAAPFTRGPSKI